MRGRALRLLEGLRLGVVLGGGMGVEDELSRVDVSWAIEAGDGGMFVCT